MGIVMGGEARPRSPSLLCDPFPEKESREERPRVGISEFVVSTHILD